MIHLTSLDNPLVKHLTKLRLDKSYRQQEQKALLIGKTLVLEVMQTGYPFITFICPESASFPCSVPSEKNFTASAEVIKKITGMESPDGYIVEIAIPSSIPLDTQHFLVACDGVSDPGNMGTLIRTALAFGWEGLFLLPGCCDLFNDKTLRAARGAQLHLAYQQGDWAALKKICDRQGLTPLVADIEGEDIRSTVLPAKPLLILGNEGQGVSTEIKKECKKIKIPIAPAMESLNVSIAGGILMYLLKEVSHV